MVIPSPYFPPRSVPSGREVDLKPVVEKPARGGVIVDVELGGFIFLILCRG
jgi:hypothetical protein